MSGYLNDHEMIVSTTDLRENLPFSNILHDETQTLSGSPLQSRVFVLDHTMNSILWNLQELQLMWLYEYLQLFGN